MHHRAFRLAPALFLALAACEGEGPAGPDTGSLTITVNASGTDPDERFAVAVNGGAERAYTGAAITTEGLAPGVHTVALSGVAPNCTVQGPSQLQVTVAAGETAAAAFTVTCAARFIVFSRPAFGPSADLYRVRRTGENLVRITENAQSGQPAVSPDGSRIAFVPWNGASEDIHVMNLDGTAPTRLTNRPAREVSPAWSPDGTRIVFVSFDGTGQTLWTVNADGSGLSRIPTVLTSPSRPRWSPDGTRNVVSNTDSNPPFSDANIYTIVVSTGAATRLTTNTGPDVDPSWTPDGRIVYAATNGSTKAVYIMDADGGNGAVLFDDPTRVEMFPRVSPDGKFLLYGGQVPATGATPLFVVPIAGGTPQEVATGVIGMADWQP